jgi:hypothetical protein
MILTVPQCVSRYFTAATRKVYTATRAIGAEDDGLQTDWLLADLQSMMSHLSWFGVTTPLLKSAVSCRAEKPHIEGHSVWLLYLARGRTSSTAGAPCTWIHTCPSQRLPALHDPHPQAKITATWPRPPSRCGDEITPSTLCGCQLQRSCLNSSPTTINPSTSHLPLPPLPSLPPSTPPPASPLSRPASPPSTPSSPALLGS